MSKASYQSRAGKGSSSPSSRSGNSAPTAAGVPRYLTSGRMTVTRRPRADAAETTADRAARQWMAGADGPVSVGRIGQSAGAHARASGGAALPAAWQTNAVTWDRILQQPSGWYGSKEAVQAAENVLRYQRHTGGWPKNIDMARPLSDAERAQLTADRRLDDSTIDNDATVTQLRFLARVHGSSTPLPALG